MGMQTEQEIIIEDAWNHSAETIGTLRRLLAGGARLQADAKRPDFFEVESRSRVYYIHISPVTGKILLLAAWPRPGVPSDKDSAGQAA